MRYVACVSYPRSGHHLTVRILSHYFGKDFNYCQFYGDCGAGCCGQFPCTDPTVTMSKNHDFELNNRWWSQSGSSKVGSVPYLVLVRNFLEAVVSDYNLYLRQNPDSEAAWHAFSKTKLRYYRRFVRKWVLTDDGLEKLVVSYEQLTENPVEEFRRILAFFDPGKAINDARLSKLVEDATLEDVRPEEVRVIRKFGVRNRRRLEDFQHFDPVYFAKLERSLSADLSRTGYPLRFAG